MSFVLVAIMVFFGLVALLYISIRMSSLKQDVNVLAQDEAMAMVRKIASSPELAFSVRDCPNCLDMDKAIALKSLTSYKNFWNLNYLRIDKVYPVQSGECTGANYPNCQSITLIEKDNFGSPPFAFVALCRQAFENGEHYPKCELGRVYATVKTGQ